MLYTGYIYESTKECIATCTVKYTNLSKRNAMKLYSVCGLSRPHTVIVEENNVDLISQYANML